LSKKFDHLVKISMMLMLSNGRCWVSCSTMQVLPNADCVDTMRKWTKQPRSI